MLFDSRNSQNLEDFQMYASETEQRIKDIHDLFFKSRGVVYEQDRVNAVRRQKADILIPSMKRKKNS